MKIFGSGVFDFAVPETIFCDDNKMRKLPVMKKAAEGSRAGDDHGGREYLDSLQSKGIHLDLENMSRLMRTLGNPHLAYRTVLVAGTNGKGSVAAMLASILRAQGMKTGLYTSPHLIDVRERIRVDDCIIPEEDLSCLGALIRQQGIEDITYFECTTALALLYFASQAVDIAVLEVGMGGALDATNLAEPLISIITGVSLDHCDYLGSRVDLIAREKGGIIKQSGICLNGARQRSVISVLQAICDERNAKLFSLGRDFSVRRAGSGFDYRGIRKQLKALHTPLRGCHQIDNAALAVAAVELLEAKGLHISDSAVAEGLRLVHWEGRLEILAEKPLVMVDGAHNPAAVSALCRSLGEDFTYNKLILVFGVLRDKDYRRMLPGLIDRAAAVILTRPPNERALDPDQLIPFVRSSLPFEVVTEPRRALKRALEIAGEDDLVCIAGSLYLVGEIKRCYQ